MNTVVFSLWFLTTMHSSVLIICSSELKPSGRVLNVLKLIDLYNSIIEVGDDEELIAARDKAKEAVEDRVEVAERNGS